MIESQPVVAIIGAGFGGINAAKELRNDPVQVILIDKNNYHLFQPLLYQVATAGLAASEIAYPVRTIFRNQRNVKFRLTEMTGLDLGARQVLTTTGVIDYDYLILGVGGENNFFGLESVARHGIGLKDLDDAIAIRNHILRMFELSTQIEDQELCDALRTFVVVGGGPTGVECAGAVSELIRLVLVKDFPELKPGDVRVLLLEMTDKLLAGFPEELAEAAAEKLKSKHVELRFDATVANYDGFQVMLKSGEVIPAYTLIWAAGVRTVSVLDEAGLPQARQGRVAVEPALHVPGHPEVFVIGDAAYLEADGQPLPMVAPVAIQQGKLAARNIRRLLAGKPLEEFEYRDPGSLATIGRNAAVARVKNFKFSGFIAWLVWLAVHIVWLIGFRNRLLVLINWASDYIFYERAVRIITPDGVPSTEDRPWPVDGVLGEVMEKLRVSEAAQTGPELANEIRSDARE